MAIDTKPIRRTTTAAELLAAGDIGRCELIRGELVMMSPAGGEHGRIAMLMAIEIGGFVLKHRLGDVYAAETGFHIEAMPDTVRAPDVAFIAAARSKATRTRKFIRGAPDLVVEVLSPEDRPRQVREKFKQWIDSGVRLAWVVDPDERSVTVHRPMQRAVSLGIADVLCGDDVLPGFELKVADIFGGYEYEEPTP